MNTPRILCATLLLSLACAPGVRAGKNLHQAQIGAPAGSFDALLSTDPGGWDFGFRPYSAAAAMAQRKFVAAAERVEQAVKAGGRHAERKLSPALAHLRKRSAVP